MTITVHRAHHDPSFLAGTRVLGLAVASVQVGRKEARTTPREVVSPLVALAKCLKRRYYLSAFAYFNNHYIIKIMLQTS